MNPNDSEQRGVRVMAAIEPSRIRTSTELTAQLVALFDRDPRGMQRLAADAGLGAGTVQHLLSGKTKIPHKETLKCLVQALGHEPGPWLEARARLAAAAREDGKKQTNPEPCGPPLGRVIGDLEESDALSLEVHQAFAAVGAVPVLPPYLIRAGFDDRLRAAVAAAERRSRLVMVIGDSSTGKTRACWEAIRAVLPDWQVWHPLAPHRSVALVGALRSNSLAGRSVIWLNEAQDYLQPPQAGEGVATALQALLAEDSIGPVLVLGTMWPDYWRILTHRPEQVTDLDPHRAARALLGGAEEITAPRQFTSRQLRTWPRRSPPTPAYEPQLNEHRADGSRRNWPEHRNCYAATIMPIRPNRQSCGPRSTPAASGTVRFCRSPSCSTLPPGTSISTPGTKSMGKTRSAKLWTD
ncbi:hypothetical protein ACQEVF_15125 [Nonomuraea polychroma]|uniref:hypothetical protein n=1 Tax=Nonomuraea polychroma TaxID=46176 RepID=UPI003D914F35